MNTIRIPDPRSHVPSPSIFLHVLRGKILFFLLFSFFIFHSSFVCFAENEFSLRLAPAFKMPMGLPQFGVGFGADASLDWAFLSFAKNFNLGVSAGGSFASISVQTGSPLILLEGKAGPFICWRPFDRWAFQAGLNIGVYNHSRGGDSNTAGLFGGTIGAQFHLSPYFSLFADGGYTWRIYSPRRPLPTLNAAFGIRINLSEIMGGKTRVQLEKTEQRRVFPVSWAWYENNPVATVKVTNEEPNAITDINLLFFMDSYMSQPWIFAALPRLDPGESVEVPITALFNEVLINLSNDVNANGIIQMRYRSLGARKESASAIQMPIHNRNALNWDDDRRAAAFVSPRDSSALHFARYVAGVVVGQGQTDTPLNVRNAAAMFEALRLYGINYVVDPASSYAALSEDASGLDSLNYPYQTIYYRSGDCDDLSILFCSLLEVIGIETAFITIPGHIYMAFEVGDNNWRMGNTDIIELDGKRWLPLEITVPDQGFVSAWRIGAREWRTGGPEASLYPIREAWKLYPAVTVPASGNRLPEMPDQAAIIRAMEVELQGKEERLLMMVYFVADRANMIERYRPAINKAGELLRANPAFHITLRGYAAPFGTAESCILVSEARTKYCKDYLVRSYGIAEGRISTENYGSEKAPESAGKDWESYRCVELILYKKEF